MWSNRNTNSPLVGMQSGKIPWKTVWQFLMQLTIILPCDPAISLLGIYPKESKTYQLSSVPQSYPTLCDPTDCSTPGFPVHYQLPELAQTHVHWVGDATKPSHSLSSPSPPAFNLSQHQRHFHWVSSLHQVARVLEFQLQHQSFQWIFRTDFF